MRRPRLLERISAGSARQVLVVRGIAGSGKTTLLCHAVQESDVRDRVGWLSLQPSHDSIGRFWVGLAAATATALDGSQSLLVGEDLAALARGETAPLLAAIDRSPDPFLVVLDDYHVINDRAIHRGLSALIEVAPAQMRIAIGSRSRPRLRLSRLRAHDRLLEIRPSELAFTRAEVHSLTNDRLGVTRESTSVALHRATRGWPAVVALAIQTVPDAAALESQLRRGLPRSGLIADYVVEELLHAQSDDFRRFVFETAHLAELSPWLCDAVRERRDSLGHLERLDHLGLTVQTGDEHTWRYHHLIGEVLKRAALVELGGDLDALYERAIAGLAGRGRFADAANHAVAYGNQDLLARHSLAAMRELQAHEADAISWFDALSDATLVAEPDLLNLMSMWVTTRGDCDRMERLVDLVASASDLSDGDRDDGEQLTELFGATVFGSDFSLALGTLERLASAQLPDLWRRFLPGFRVFALHAAGDTKSAADLAASSLIDPPGPLFRRSMAGLSAAMNMHLGDVERAADLLDSCPGDVDDVMVDFSVNWARSLLAARRGDVAEASRLFELAERWTGTSGWPRAAMLIERIQLQLATDRRYLALESYDELGRTLLTIENPGPLLAKARELGRQLGAPDPTSDPRRGIAVELGLTEREIEVLFALDGDESLRLVAEDLYISPNTLKTHARAVYRKLGVQGRGGARALIGSWST